MTMSTTTTSAIAPSAFFEIVYNGFRCAVESSHCVDRYFHFAGYDVHLQYAGSSLVQFSTEALGHLLSKHVPDTIDLTICIWDSDTTIARSINAFNETPGSLQTRRGELLNYSSDQYQTAFQPDAGILSLIDKSRNLALVYIQNLEPSVYKSASPFHLVLHWWLREKRLYVIHSAAIGLEQGAALLIGRSGAGKSTSALACLQNGMKFIADDRCVVSLDPEPVVYALYNSGKVFPGQMDHFPDFQNSIINPEAQTPEKNLMFVHQFDPERIALQLPVRVIFLSRLTHQKETTLSSVKLMEVCQVLAVSTMLYTPGWSQTDLKASVQLVQSVPCYAINLGEDLSQIPKLISQVIRTETADE